METWQMTVTKSLPTHGHKNNGYFAVITLEPFNKGRVYTEKPRFSIIKYSGAGSDEVSIDSSAFGWPVNGWNAVPANVLEAYMLLVFATDPNTFTNVDKMEETIYEIEANHRIGVAKSQRSYDLTPITKKEK